jgi:hypothetical protein
VREAEDIMGTSIIDGTIGDAQLKRARAGIAIFSSIRFKLDDGSPRTITKAVLKQSVADEIKPGSRGRFYLFSAFDISGIHGVRLADGRSAYGFPGNNKRVFLIVTIVNILWVFARIAIDGKITFLGVGLAILGTVGFIFMRKGEREAQQQYDSDAGYAAPPAPPAPAVPGL